MARYRKLAGRGLVALLCAAMLIGLSLTGSAGAGADADQVPTLKAAFVYVGPIGDLGWTHAHDQGRLIAEETFPWLETVYVESVAEGDVEAVIDRLINQEQADVVFTTSFGFMDGTLAAARRYPGKVFAHCSGFKRAPNMATYMADFYQVYYLNGLMAGALTKTGVIGYVGAFPIPELKRHINAFTIGIREVNPEATVHVRWLETAWYDPPAAKEAAEALIAEGADGLAFTEDSPTVLQVAQEHMEKGEFVFGFGHYSPMYKFAPDAAVSGQLVHWEEIYLDFLAKVYAGVYTPENLADVDYWWLLGEGAVELGADFGMPINPAFEDALKAVTVVDPVLGEISVYDLIFVRLEQMSDPSMVFDPFTGPIYDRKGKLRVPEGLRLSMLELTTMEWAVEGVVGPWPGEPE